MNNNGNINNNNNNTNGVRPVASIHCGYAIINCIRDNIETNHCPLVKRYCQLTGGDKKGLFCIF
ncbi:MAG: hypothetical protein IJH76_06685 [Clostridia bacterium]|nr:hypothetical protein [Clostridia bacterium]